MQPYNWTKGIDENGEYAMMYSPSILDDVGSQSKERTVNPGMGCDVK